MIISCSNHTASQNNNQIATKADTDTGKEMADTQLAIDSNAYAKETVNEASALKLEKFLRSYFKKDLSVMDSNDRKFSFYEIDLNDDRKPEFFIWLRSPYFCGTGGCTFLLLDQDMKFIQRFTVMDPPVFRSSNLTNGWHDLILISSQSAEKTVFRHLKFDSASKKYPTNPSLVAESEVAPAGSDFIMWDENFSRAKEFVF